MITPASNAKTLTELGQKNVAAMMKSSQVWSEGVADMSKSIAASMQAKVERTTALMHALRGATSLKEALELQTKHAQASLAEAISDATRLAEVSARLATDTMAPLKLQMTAAVETFTRGPDAITRAPVAKPLWPGSISPWPMPGTPTPILRRVSPGAPDRTTRASWKRGRQGRSTACPPCSVSVKYAV